MSHFVSLSKLNNILNFFEFPLNEPKNKKSKINPLVVQNHELIQQFLTDHPSQLLHDYFLDLNYSSFSHEEIKNLQLDVISQKFQKQNVVTPRDSHLFNIVQYIISFPKEEPIDLSITQTKENVSLLFGNIHSLYLYIAATYRREPHIPIHITNNLQFTLDYLELDMDSSQNFTPSINYHDQDSQFLWNLNNELLSNTWSNKTFVLEKISTSPNNYKSYVPLIAKELLQDHDFINQAVLKNIKFIDDLIENDIMSSFDLAQLFSNNATVLSCLWKKELAKQYSNSLLNAYKVAVDEFDPHSYNQDIRSSIYYYEKSLEDLDNFDNLLEFDRQQKYIEQSFEQMVNDYSQKINATKHINEFFNNHIFTNVELSLDFLSIEKNSLSIVLPYLSPELFKEDRFINLLLHNIENNKDYHLLPTIPVDILDNNNIYKNTFINLAFDSDNSLSYLTHSHWFSNKESILSTLNTYQTYGTIVKRRYGLSNLSDHEIKIIYNQLIPSELQQDSDIVNSLLQINKQFFRLLPHTLKNNLTILENYLNLSNELIYSDGIDPDTILSLSNYSHIAKYISHHDNFLNKKDCPSDWRTNPTILLALGERIKNIKFTANEKNFIFSNQEFTLQLLSKTPSLYLTLPEEDKDNLAYALSYLHSHSNNNQKSNIQKITFNPILYSYDSFCLTLLQLFPDMIQHIPTFHWENRKFLREVFNQLDEKILPKSILEKAPTKIKKFLEVFDINNNYLTFFNNYIVHEDLQKKLKINKAVTTHKKKI